MLFRSLSEMHTRRDPEFVRSAPTLEALAEKIGLDPKKLAATVERFNGWSREGVDRDFHRGETAWERYYTGDPKKGAALKPLEKPPFFASPFLYVSLGTKAGECFKCIACEPVAFRLRAVESHQSNERALSLMLIFASTFAERCSVRLDIKNIVSNLECRADSTTIISQSFTC